MSPTFVKYQNAVDIGNLGAPATWNTIDLDGLYDSNAIGLTLMITSNVDDQIGVAEVGASAVIRLTTILLPFTWMEVAVSLRGASSIISRHTFAGGTILITGEIHGPDAVLHDDVIIQSTVEAQFNTWVQRTVTVLGGDVVGDVEGVILRALPRDGGQRGVRKLGSTTTNAAIRDTEAHTWFVVGVDDDGIYETYSGGKTTTNDETFIMQEVGYILKTSDVTTIINPLDDNVDPALANMGYLSLDLSSFLPAGTSVAGLKWVNSDAADGIYGAFARQVDSTDDSDDLLGRFCRGIHDQNQILAVGSDRLAEYRLSDTDIDLYIDWYEAASVGRDMGWMASQNSRRNQMHNIVR